MEIQWNPRCFQRDLTEVKKLKTLTSHRKINDELNETGIYHQALKLIIYNPGLLKSYVSFHSNKSHKNEPYQRSSSLHWCQKKGQ